MRKSHLCWLSLTLAAALLVACGGAGGASPTARGRTVFEGTCAACHGPEAKGMPGLGKDLTTSEFVRGQSDADLIEFVRRGRPISDPLNTTKVEMPPKGGNGSLTDQDLADVVAYLRTLQK